MKFRMILLFIVLGLITTGCANRAKIAATTKPVYEPLERCFADQPEDLNLEVEPECGYVTVPESRNTTDGATLKLGVMRLKSKQATNKSPLFMLAGGPGQAEITTVMYMLLQPELLGRLLEHRDIVMMEQRGTRNTSQYLDCPEVNSIPWKVHERGLSEEEAVALGTQVLQQCVDRLKPLGIDLDAYNSVENAADVDAVRQAFGYDQIIYYGASYGSQLGQHVMRDFPEILEAVILDGANSLSRKSWVEDRALDAQWGIDNLTKLCEADQACHENYDIPALVDASLALFDDGPIPYSYTDPTDPSVTIDGMLTTTDLANFIYASQGSWIGAFSLPAMLQIFSSGGIESLQEMLGQVVGRQVIASRTATSEGGMAVLMHAAMVCSDDPVHSVDEVITSGTGQYATLFGLSLGTDYARLCSIVQVRELPDSTDVDVSTNVPVLLLTGDIDVSTPSFRSQIVADALPNATLLVFPGRTHVQLAGANLCAYEIVSQFTQDPQAPLDTSCIENARVLGFVLPDGSMTTDAKEDQEKEPAAGGS